MTDTVFNTFDDYRKYIQRFRVYDEDKVLEYASWGLVSEIGELAGVIAKEIRGDDFDFNARILDELGDVLFMIAELATGYHRPFPFSESEWGRVRSAEGRTVGGCVATLSRGLSDASYSQSRTYMLSVCAEIAGLCGASLQHVAAMNVEKLESRKRAGTIQGHNREAEFAPRVLHVIEAAPEINELEIVYVVFPSFAYSLESKKYKVVSYEGYAKYQTEMGWDSEWVCENVDYDTVCGKLTEHYTETCKLYPEQ